ncbi:putative nucleotidyltransferase substrate binding domain-containing protein [Paragemmobacter ruber]|uniref:DUF294 domain-containing protein n=1 Tax=Paragemmobacter ruber TaxID=1985673 RepID=A0ABW9Y5A0_9RHOB|nr:putative nucleotidyltransferase substrate binding domain-containing protein [Rhodobacter ruber]NBE07742.1 hypothetical protein [Rhodobacter ruber]
MEGDHAWFVLLAVCVADAPPVGLLRGFATIRSGGRKNQIAVKHLGVVPVTELARIHAMIGRLAPANTRARLEHQARQVRAGQRRRRMPF